MRPHRFLLFAAVFFVAQPIAARPGAAELTARYTPTQALRTRLLLDVALGKTLLEFGTWGSGLLIPSRHAVRGPGFFAGPAAPSGLVAELLAPIASGGSNSSWSEQPGFRSDFGLTPVSREALALEAEYEWSRIAVAATASAWREDGMKAATVGADAAYARETGGAARVTLLASRASLSPDTHRELEAERIEAGWFPGPAEVRAISHVLGSVTIETPETSETTLDASVGSGYSIGPAVPPGVWLRIGATVEHLADHTQLLVTVPLYAAVASPGYVTGKLREVSNDGTVGAGASVETDAWRLAAEAGVAASWLSAARSSTLSLDLLAPQALTTAISAAVTPDDHAVTRVKIRGLRSATFSEKAESAVVYEINSEVSLAGREAGFDGSIRVGGTWEERWEYHASLAVGLALDQSRLSWMPEGVELIGRARGGLEIGEDVEFDVTGSLLGRVGITAPE
ncbi:MAG: hypothetical protein ACOC8L_02520 [Spirochaetota bacterium]